MKRIRKRLNNRRRRAAKKHASLAEPTEFETFATTKDTPQGLKFVRDTIERPGSASLKRMDENSNVLSEGPQMKRPHSFETFKFGNDISFTEYLTKRESEPVTPSIDLSFGTLTYKTPPSFVEFIKQNVLLS